MDDLQRVGTGPAQARDLVDRLEAKVAAQSTFGDVEQYREMYRLIGDPGLQEPPD